MISRLKELLATRLLTGHARTVKAKRNIAGLIALRPVSIFINFLLVPLTLNYLNPTRYGIWLTLTSVLNWVNVLDIGLGTGLRNKYAEALARGDDELARSYVSTSYAFIGMIALVAIIVFLVVNPLLNWARILNAGPEMQAELGSLASVVFTFFCLRVLFGLVGTLLVADQRPAMNNVLEVVTNLLSLIVVYILTKTTAGSLFWLGFSVSFITAIVPLVANFWYFNRKYRRYRPSRAYVNMRYARELVGLGIQFFILQLAGILVFASSNIIIAQVAGPSEVTPFNIAFKYYGVASMAFLMVLTPFWSAYTDAFVRGDNDWITRTNRRLKQVWVLLLVGVVVMTALAGRAYSLWVGDKVQVPFALSALMGLYVLIVAWSNIFAYFINGTGKIRLQIWAAVGVSILNVGLAILLAGRLSLGGTGVVLASCIALLPGCFIWPIQMKKLVSGTADGIWAK